MKRLLLAAMALYLLLPRAEAAGTLKSKESADLDIQIRDHVVDAVIDNGYARVEVTQTFFNPNARDLQAIYTFPVPESASLSEITIWNGERVLNGEVIEASEAERVYEEERAAGNDAGLGQCSCDKPKNDVEYHSYKFSVSPVRANAETKIRFVYYQPLPIDTAIGRFVYPLEEGGTDEAAKAFWTRNTKVEQRFAVNVEIKSGWPIDDVRVPAPDAVVTKLDEGHYKVALERTTGDLGKDFVLYYRLADKLPGRVELMTYKPEADKPGTFMLTVTPGVDLGPITGGADYVFVLDNSGSMEGKLATLARGVQQALGQFASGDRFRIVVFSSSARELTPGWVTVTPDTVAEWSTKVEAIRTEGGTNVFEGLELGLKSLDADRATSILLVTDGVANEGIVEPKEFAALLRSHDVRVFGFLMGQNANWPLMRLIADVSGGFYAAVSNDDDIIGRILLAKDKIRSEALHDAKLKIRGVKTFETNDEAIGKIYRGQQVVIFGKYDRGGKATVTLEAKLTGKDETYSTTFDFPEVDDKDPELERLWALHRIEQIQRQEMVGVLPPTEAEQMIRDVGIRYQLVTDYTSMVVLADDDFAKRGIERKNKARIERERSAQAHRVTAPPVKRRVDTAQPMFNGPAHSTGGGGAGALDPISVAIALALGAAAIGARRKPTTK